MSLYVDTFNLNNTKILRGAGYRMPDFVRKYVRPPRKASYTHTHAHTHLLLYWWEQPIDLNEASKGAPADATTEGDRGDGERAPYPLDKTPNM